MLVVGEAGVGAGGGFCGPEGDGGLVVEGGEALEEVLELALEVVVGVGVLELLQTGAVDAEEVVAPSVGGAFSDGAGLGGEGGDVDEVAGLVPDEVFDVGFAEGGFLHGGA